MPVRRPAVRWLTLTVVVAVLAAGGFVAFGGIGGVRKLTASAGLWSPARATGPQFGAPKPVLGAAASTGKATAAGLARVLEPLASDRRLGQAAVSVVDVATGESLFAQRADAPVTPASNTKIMTATAALAALGPYRRFTTKVVAGAAPGEVVLVGGGDPTLTVGPTGSYAGAARLDVLAKAVKAAGPVRKLLYDTSLFTGPTTGPGWDSDAVSQGYAAPVSALMIDGGRLKPKLATKDPEGARASDPAQYAARALARLLGGVPVAQGTAPDGARELGHVQSPPAVSVVEQMLQLSDNVLAEVLLRQVAVAKGQPATFAGGAAAAREVLAAAGIDQTANALRDGSGLSRENRISAALLTSVLRATTDKGHAQLRGVLAGLPVAAYSGTLTKRFGAPGSAAAAGDVRAKTGTLTGVNALSGVVVTGSGQLLAFSVVANGVPVGKADAEAALDKIGAALASCGCE